MTQPLRQNASERDRNRWQALKTRDRDADGRFVYGVSSTGVYCRPSCGARLPRIENVLFFATADEAEGAGFRACKRCKPRELAPFDARAKAIAQACALIENGEGPPDLQAIADTIGLSRHHFHRVFKTVMGMTPGAYVRAVRARRAVSALGEGRVTDAIYDAGYGSSSRFYETVAPKLGIKPKNFAQKGAGEVIRFAVGACSLGAVLVAATDKGVCAIELGDDPDTLVKGLQDRFAQARLIGADAAFETRVACVIGLLEEPNAKWELPLHVRGTAFQQKVWQALQTVPCGKTVSYADLAALIDKPEAVRAVAGACAKNTLAVAIPCHRVVRTDGSLSGYRWGVERKAALLAREKEA